MDIHPRQTARRQCAGLDEGEHFLVLHERRLRKIPEQAQDLASATERAAGELADDERMAEHGVLHQQPHQLLVGDPQMIAALAMRKLQALHLLSTPGVRTTTDVVITIVSDLDRALLQAPVMHLRRLAATTDWDAAFAALDEPATVEGPAHGDDEDPEIRRFHMLHAQLHEAVRAIVEASEGRIRIFE